MTALEQAITAIRKINNPEDLIALYAEVKRQERYMSTQNARSFAVGDTVQFKSRNKGYIRGKIVKKNRKTVEVAAQVNGMFGLTTQEYRVPASMLEAV